MSTRTDSQYASLLAQPQNDLAPKPTIFDVIAQENMHQLFRTAFNHLFKWLAESEYTRRIFRKFLKYKDGIYLVIHGAIEFLYLKAYDGLFSETFYGMKRANLNTNFKRVISIVFSVVIPYLKAKLDEIFEELERLVDEPEIAPVEEGKFRRVFNKIMLKVYPFFNLLWHSVFWFFRFRFMINASSFNSPLLSVLKLKLVYNISKYLCLLLYNYFFLLTFFLSHNR